MGTSRVKSWNDRYNRPGWYYGTAPNEFLESVAHRVPPGPVLCLGAGQGRNAVYLATLGHPVEAVDLSDVGLARARELADDRGVRITTTVADLADLPITEGHWSGIVSIFCHLPPAVRRDLHRRVVRGLRPGGVFVLEAYTPEQVRYQDVGPPDPSVLYALEDLRDDLSGLTLAHATEVLRELHEGAHHEGLSAVVQVLAVKPSASR